MPQDQDQTEKRETGAKAPRRYCCEAAEAYLRELAADGIAPTWDDVCAIQHYADKLERPEPPSAPATGTPRRACESVWLWPLTIQAAAWLNWLADEIGADDALLFPATGFAMAHARILTAFATLYNVAEARRVVKRWYDSLPCRQAELSEAIAAICRDDDHEDLRAKRPDAVEAPFDADELVTMLVATCGGTPDYWSRSVSNSYVRKQLRAVGRVRAAEAGAKAAFDASSAEIRATVNLGIIMDAIRAREKAKAANV